MFDLKRPCPDCPFRTDRSIYITAARAREIAKELENDKWFACHATTIDDGEGEMAIGPRTQHCFGAAVAMHRSRMPNQLMRIWVRTGFDPNTWDATEPVASSLGEFVKHHKRGKVRT